MAGGLIMNLNFDFGIQGKVKYELIDTRTGEVEETRENNMLLDSYLDGIFNSRRGLLDEEIFDMCYLGDSDIAPSRSQLGLQGSILASSSPLEKVEDNLGLLRNNNQLITTFTGHSSTIKSVAFSPDGTKVVSGSDDSTAKVWEYDTGNVITTFTGHSNDVNSVAFSPDGNYVVSGSDDNTAKVWEYDTGNVITTFTGHSNDVWSVAFSPDGNYVVSGSIDNTAKVWEYDTGNVITTFTGHSNDVNSVAFSPDGNYVVSGSDDNTAKVWEYDTGNVITTFTGHSGIVYSVAFSPDGTKVVSGSYDSTPKVWEADTGNLITTFTDHSDWVWSVAFSPDGTKVVSGSYDKTAKVWEADTGNLITTFTGHSNYVYSVAFSPDGTKVVSGSYDSTPKVWEANFGLLNTAKMGYKYRFGAGSGTAMLIKEIALRADDYNYYNAEWVARQVPPNPIDKKDYHQLDITWTIEVQSPNIYYTTTIANGQRDGTSIDIDVEIANRALADISKFNLKSLDSFFGISGTPQFALGTSNAKKYPLGTENIELGLSLEGTDISGGFIAPFEVTQEPYTAGSYSRTFRVGLESDQGNHADGLGEIILRNSAEDYFGRVLFTPALQKINTFRFYFDVTFSLNPN
jgi:WD40 repeat protein